MMSGRKMAGGMGGQSLTSGLEDLKKTAGAVTTTTAAAVRAVGDVSQLPVATYTHLLHTYIIVCNASWCASFTATCSCCLQTLGCRISRPHTSAMR